MSGSESLFVSVMIQDELFNLERDDFFEVSKFSRFNFILPQRLSPLFGGRPLVSLNAVEDLQIPKNRLKDTPIVCQIDVNDESGFRRLFWGNSQLRLPIVPDYGLTQDHDLQVYVNAVIQAIPQLVPNDIEEHCSDRLLERRSITFGRMSDERLRNLKN